MMDDVDVEIMLPPFELKLAGGITHAEILTVTVTMSLPPSL